MARGLGRNTVSGGHDDGTLVHALSLHRAGRLSEAEKAYRAALDRRPADTEARHLLGVAVLQQGRAEEATLLIEDAIRRAAGVASSDLAVFHDNHGSALAALGRTDEAADAHRRAIRLRPDFAEARFNLGNALAGSDETRATFAFAEALALRPDYAKAWFNLGNVWRSRTRYELAASAFARAVHLAPDMAEARTNLGDALAALGRPAEAVAHHRRAVELRPGDAGAWYNLGVALQHNAALEEAEIAYREAIRRDPRHFGALNNLGSVLRRLGRPAQAERCHRAALEHNPDFVEARHNLGNALLLLGRFDEASECFEEVLRCKPDLSTAVFNLGRLALTHGDLRRGWAGYDGRFLAGEARPDRRWPVPDWTGGATDAHLLIWREQGLGDEILFSSTYPDVADRLPFRVVVEADRRLVPLFRRAFPKLDVREETTPGEPGATEIAPDGVTAQVPAGTLPRFLRPSLAAFPVRQQWLTPDPRRSADWRIRLDRLPPGPRIGISWTSQLVDHERRAEYTALSDWAPVFALPGLVLVTLQYGDTEREIADAEARFGIRLHRWPDLDLRNDLDGLAGLIRQLDLVLTVGTAVGELAGALGVPVWRLGRGTEWSALGTACRPWYATMRTLRPLAGSSLPDAIAAAARRLALLLPAPACDPAAAEAFLDRAIALHRAGRLAEAEALYGEALRFWPGHTDALHLKGLAAHQAGRSGEAKAAIAAALRRDPEFPKAWNNLGLVARARGEIASAERAFRFALALDPGFAEAATHLGLVRQTLSDHLGAVHWQRRALRLSPDRVSHWVNLGSALDAVGGYPEARKAYRVAVTLDPTCADALNNLGNMARYLDSEDGAERWFRRAVRADPSFALAAWNAGLLDLTHGRYAEGWSGYERRFETDAVGPVRAPPLPRWAGEPLTTERLLVWNEQGLGDEVLFASCLDDLRPRAQRIVVSCDRRLVPLLARANPSLDVRAEGDPIGDCDWQLAIGSLPRLVRSGAADATRRAPAPWLRPDPELRATWRRRVERLGPGLRVGIAWRSGHVTAARRSSYTDLADWAPVLATAGVIPVNLQYGDCEAEVRREEERLGIAVARWPDLDLRDDLESVAALIAALDLVIIVPTAAGEIAGALGTPVWRLCRPDWTWLGSAVRPWMPTMRAFAPRPGETMPLVLERVARALVRHARRVAG